MADLIVNNQEPRVDYLVSNPAVVDYTALFEILREDDVSVYLVPVGDEPDPPNQLLTLNTDYTVTGAGLTGGFQITIQAVITLQVGDHIIMERNLPYDRLTDFSVGGQFKSLTINEQLDRLVMQIQQVDNLIANRGLTYLVTDTLTSGQTTIPKLAAGEFWKANGVGNIAAVVQEENPDWSTLRSELASNTQVAPGAELIGYYDATHGYGPTNLDAYLKTIIDKYVLKTGMITATVQIAAMDGWIVLGDSTTSPNQTIGNASSGADIRANADCQNLFVLIWNNTQDANCPVSGGRGASALADWNANKTIGVPLVEGRTLAAVEWNIQPPAFTLGEKTHTMTNDELNTHKHSMPFSIRGQVDGTPGSGDWWCLTSTNETETSGLNQPFNIIQPTIAVVYQMKL